MRAAFLAGTLLLIAAHPICAQEARSSANPPASGGQIGKATAAQNLDCAVWASYLLNTSQDPANNTGLVATLAWFAGLYEGKTGKTISAPLRARIVQLSPADLAAIGPQCAARMAAFAARVDKPTS